MEESKSTSAQHRSSKSHRSSQTLVGLASLLDKRGRRDVHSVSRRSFNGLRGHKRGRNLSRRARKSSKRICQKIKSNSDNQKFLYYQNIPCEIEEMGLFEHLREEFQ
jgi:hypothetical protein